MKGLLLAVGLRLVARTTPTREQMSAGKRVLALATAQALALATAQALALATAPEELPFA
jgi:hypothetical protein